MTLTKLLVTMPVLIACGGGGGSPNDPANVPFGTTALVVVVNPAVNDGNAHAVPAPGPARSGVTLTTDDHVSATTGADGIAVLAPVAAGTRTVTASGGAAGTFTVTIADGALHEVAVAADSGHAQIMVDVDYKTDQAVMLDPAMSPAQISAALAVSDSVVFFSGGTYHGDLEVKGSRVTLFGEGALGGKVTLAGNVTVSGSDSRIRAAHVTGNVVIPASKVGLAFSRVDGALTVAGSDGIVLANALCGSESVTGSGTIVLGNAGVAPTTSCP